jgi:hypothetical protein
LVFILSSKEVIGESTIGMAGQNTKNGIENSLKKKLLQKKKTEIQKSVF